MEGAQAGRQAGVLPGFVSLSGSGAGSDSDTAAADSGDCNIAILGVDLLYLSQEIPDDFTFGTRYMYTLRCTTTHEWRRIQWALFVQSNRKEKRTGKKFTQISRKKIIHSTILDTIQTIGTTI